jgi:hypothetical protein
MCQPNVVPEPNQVNFACGKTTSQVLWVFSLINANFRDGRAWSRFPATQGGEVAWSQNLPTLQLRGLLRRNIGSAQGSPLRRRRTGIEPAAPGLPTPPVLKTGEPTRNPDASSF